MSDPSLHEWLPEKAISVYQGRAHIDYDVCVECGNCKRACPYGAVVEISRPCENACKVHALHMGADKRRKSIKMSVWNAVPAVGLALRRHRGTEPHCTAYPGPQG
ncbi:4Fe-4S binding protein [Acidaminococcus intestini]|nr:4Fe-4S binding protein [Acidaminococcus intestini]